MSAQVTQTLVNAILLIGVTLIAGSIGLKRFEAIDRRFEAIDRRFEAMERSIGDLRSELKGEIADLRGELKHDIALVDAHVGEVRAELTRTRSDLTYVALAVGGRRAEGSG